MNIHSIEKFKESVDKKRVRELESERNLLRAEVTNLRELLREESKRANEYKDILDELKKEDLK